MRLVQAIVYDDEPPGSPMHGLPPVVMDAKACAAYESARCVWEITDAMIKRRETGDIGPLLGAIEGIQRRAIASAANQ